MVRFDSWVQNRSQPTERLLPDDASIQAEIQMPRKMARPAPRPPFGPPERPVNVGASLVSCGKAEIGEHSPQLGSYLENTG